MFNLYSNVIDAHKDMTSQIQQLPIFFWKGRRFLRVANAIGDSVSGGKILVHAPRDLRVVYCRLMGISFCDHPLAYSPEMESLVVFFHILVVVENYQSFFLVSKFG